MARARIEEIRRRELVQAAWEVLQRQGAAGTTLQRVADQAGVSKGIVLHYFANKDALIEGAMRYVNLLLRDHVVALLRRAGSPRARIDAVVEGNFAPAFFKPEIAHAWLALCSAVPHNRQFARVQTAIHRRMHSNLMSGLTALMPRAEAEAAALGISALIDGLWLRCGLQTGGIDRDHALEQMRLYLASVVDRKAQSGLPPASPGPAPTRPRS